MRSLKGQVHWNIKRIIYSNFEPSEIENLYRHLWAHVYKQIQRMEYFTKLKFWLQNGVPVSIERD